MPEGIGNIAALAEARHKRNGGVDPADECSTPIIRIEPGKLSEMATAAERSLIDSSVPIYRRGSVLVRPVVEEAEAAHGRRTQVAQLARVEAAYLRDALGRVASWQRYSQRQKEWIAADPPRDVADTILARYGEWGFRPVVGVLTTPTLRPDGTCLSTPGYDPVTRLVLVAPLAMPDVPPTRENAERAMQLLAGLVAEFPFAEEASRSVALAAMITPVVRAAFPVAPMFVCRAPVSGSGKSYLFDVVGAISTGQLMPVTASGRTEEETEKRLGAALLHAQSLISIDNANGELGGDFLCQAIERHALDVRILGRSERVRIEARGTTFFATGNNIALRGDMTRRGLLCTLDPKCERPEQRRFNSDPVVQVLADRGRYVAAALCIVRAYIAAERPVTTSPLASFGPWSDSVRSALIWLGRADPVETMEVARAEDPERAALAELLSAWAASIGTGWEYRRTVAEVLKAVEERDMQGAESEPPYRNPALRDAVLAIAPRGRIDPRSFGNWLRSRKGRIIDGLSLASKADDHGHRAEWWIERC